MRLLSKAVIERDVSLRPFNTFGVEASVALRAGSHGGSAPRIGRSPGRDVPRRVLGGGSNVLFTRDFDGLVMKVDIAGVERR